jgi:uncharacterized protein (TIGR02145 family)
MSGICPEGWHVPADEEWTILTDYLGGLDFAGGKLKSIGTIEDGDGLWQQPNEGATNESSFTGLPGGYRSGSGGSLANQHFQSCFWTSTISNGEWSYVRSFSYNNHEVNRYVDTMDTGYSIRCVLDPVQGDVNADGELNILDVVLGINIILEMVNFTDTQQSALDYNGDGDSNIIDLVQMVGAILNGI